MNLFLPTDYFLGNHLKVVGGYLNPNPTFDCLSEVPIDMVFRPWWDKHRALEGACGNNWVPPSLEPPPKQKHTHKKPMVVSHLVPLPDVSGSWKLRFCLKGPSKFHGIGLNSLARSFAWETNSEGRKPH